MLGHRVGRGAGEHRNREVHVRAVSCAGLCSYGDDDRDPSGQSQPCKNVVRVEFLASFLIKCTALGGHTCRPRAPDLCVFLGVRLDLPGHRMYVSTCELQSILSSELTNLASTTDPYREVSNPAFTRSSCWNGWVSKVGVKLQLSVLKLGILWNEAAYLFLAAFKTEIGFVTGRRNPFGALDSAFCPLCPPTHCILIAQSWGK